MGIRDYISSTIDSLKHSLKRIWGYVSTVIDSLKQRIPDLTSIKNACQSSYDNICATVSKIDHTVRVNVHEKLNQYFPDKKARSQFAINLAKIVFDIGFREGSKYVPGGVRLYRIASKSLSDVKKFEDPKKEFKALKLRVDKLEEEVSMCRKVLEQAEMHKQADMYERDVELNSQNMLHFDSNVHQTPDDYGDQNLHNKGIHVPLAWVI